MADTLGFVLLHVACVAVVVVGVSIQAVVIAAVTYALRCFGVAAGFHRYFSHRSFRAGRAVQFSLALLGTLALQKGVLWWASTHRRHHAVADTPADVHSPHHRSFLYSHCGWFIDPANQGVDERRVRDLVCSSPSRTGWTAGGSCRSPCSPSACGALGPTVFVWAFCVSTVADWHATLSTGSFSHRFGGYRTFDTPDDSRNNRVIAAVLLGEGWHNNHHHRPRAVNHGHAARNPIRSTPAGASSSGFASSPTSTGLRSDRRSSPRAVRSGTITSDGTCRSSSMSSPTQSARRSDSRTDRRPDRRVGRREPHQATTPTRSIRAPT